MVKKLQNLFYFFFKIEFLFVSPVSFLNDLSPSFIEDYVQKHTYEHFYTGHFGFLKKACSKNFKLMNYKR